MSPPGDVVRCLCLLPLLACGSDNPADAALDATSALPSDAGSRDGAPTDSAQLLDASADADAAPAPAPTLATLLSGRVFALLFPHQGESACNAQLYDYDSLLVAAERFPGFASEGSEQVRRRELAAFLANISHETTGGWATAPDGPHAWGLCLREEVGCVAGGCTQYCEASNTTYPCAAGQTYHGRGPLQLSWNYNYGRVGKELSLDLLNDPGLVTRDGKVGFETALWFWMTAQAPKPSAHAVMIDTWKPSADDVAAGRLPGFGMTVNIINGGLECSIANDPRVEDRVGFYQRYATLLGTELGDHVRCDAMKPY